MSIIHHLKNNQSILVFGEDWGKHPSSTQHLINELKKNRKIIWVNSIGLRKPKLTWRDIIRVGNKLLSYIKGQKKDSSKESVKRHNITVINPLVIPCASSWLSLIISRWLLARQIHKVLKHNGINNPLIWCSLPTAIDYLTLIPHCASVYYCGDDFGSLAGVDHQIVLEKEESLVAQVKYIFTASHALLSKFPKRKTIVIPHGVNYRLFNKQSSIRPIDLPQDKPIAGFYGSISTWLDQKLVLKAAKSLPHWSFVFIGNVECNIDLLLDVKNIHFLGAKQHHELPSYIQSWNVALLPFKDNKQIQMCNPLKLREYMASGTPIVTTHFNALEEYKNHVMVINERLDISQAILLANAGFTNNLNIKKIKKIEKIDELVALTKIKVKRTKSVLSESWKNRAEKIDKYISTCQ